MNGCKAWDGTAARPVVLRVRTHLEMFSYLSEAIASASSGLNSPPTGHHKGRIIAAPLTSHEAITSASSGSIFLHTRNREGCISAGPKSRRESSTECGMPAIRKIVVHIRKTQAIFGDVLDVRMFTSLRARSSFVVRFTGPTVGIGHVS
jgi:hypothetical protein